MSFWFRKALVATIGQGHFEVTEDIHAIVKEVASENGVLVILCPHTTANVFLQERKDLTAKVDLKTYISRLPEVLDILPKHTTEGVDDSPAYLAAPLVGSTPSLTVKDGNLILGRWQGVFVWERRLEPRERELLIAVYGKREVR